MAFSLPTGNRTHLWLIGMWGTRNEMLGKQFWRSWQEGEWGAAAPASQPDDSHAINNQKPGEVIANVNLKFSLVKTKIVLSPNQCRAKLCCLLSSWSLENSHDLTAPWVVCVLSTDKFPACVDVHYQWCHLMKEVVVTLWFISHSACLLWGNRLGVVLGTEVLSVFVKGSLSLSVYQVKIFKNREVYLFKGAIITLPLTLEKKNKTHSNLVPGWHLSSIYLQHNKITWLIWIHVLWLCLEEHCRIQPAQQQGLASPAELSLGPYTWQ